MLNIVNGKRKVITFNTFASDFFESINYYKF